MVMRHFPGQLRQTSAPTGLGAEHLVDLVGAQPDQSRARAVGQEVSTGDAAAQGHLADSGPLGCLGEVEDIAAAALYDIATRGRVHPVLAWGSGAYALAFAAAAGAYHSDWWPAWVRGALGLAAAA